jgi:hypothetical protein
MCLASLRHISGVERILPKGQNALVFCLSGRCFSLTTPFIVCSALLSPNCGGWLVTTIPIWADKCSYPQGYHLGA